MNRLELDVFEGALQDRARCLAMLQDIHRLLCEGKPLLPNDRKVFGGSETAVELIGAAIQEMKSREDDPPAPDSTFLRTSELPST